MWPFYPLPLNPKTRLMNGIDVSHWNGVIDWYKVANQNTPKIEFAFIKTSNGSSGVDEKSKFNATEAKRFGIKIGYYHFCSLNDKNEIQDSTAEARWFATVLKNLPPADLPLILDLEDNNPKVQLEDGEIVNWVKNFFSTLASLGYTNYALYSYTPFLQAHLPTPHDLGHLRLWLAQYSNRPYPKMPPGWDKYWIWQYTDSGQVVGIKGKVDLNKTIAL
jgi:lysozyme